MPEATGAPSSALTLIAPVVDLIRCGIRPAVCFNAAWEHFPLLENAEMARTSAKPQSRAAATERRPQARPIGKTVTGKPTLSPTTKDKIDVAGEASFPASDPPAAASPNTPATPRQDISPAHYLSPQEIKERKSR